MITILSYNIQLGKKMPKIINWLHGMVKKPDIVCFQEFPERHIADCIEALSAVPYVYRFAASRRNKDQGFGELTLFRTDRLRIVSSKILSLGSNTLERSVFRNSMPRNCLITVFEHKKYRFEITNVHLICWALNALRYKQLEMIIAALEKKHMPSIILGDFNISSVFGRKRLVSLMKEHSYSTNEKYIATHKIAFMHQQLDYIFGKDCAIQSIAVERIKLSDHFPLHIELRMS
jgi:endonuclease/exonuclease/phosphatase family metal-dependent hydrolase